MIIKEIFRLFMESAESSFIEVTVFVGAVLFLFEYINFVQKGGLVKKIENSKKIQPIIGAFLGLTPGCGGAIFVVPLFTKGTVTFGTVIATLIATMGDSAFVLMTTMPMHYLLVSALSFIVGIVSGYIVDMTNIGDKCTGCRRRCRRHRPPGWARAPGSCPAIRPAGPPRRRRARRGRVRSGAGGPGWPRRWPRASGTPPPPGR